MDIEHFTDLAVTLDWQQITRLALRSRLFMLTVGLTVREALLVGMALSGSPSQGRDAGMVFNLPPHGGAARGRTGRRSDRRAAVLLITPGPRQRGRRGAGS